jgi:hypothetical protein
VPAGGQAGGGGDNTSCGEIWEKKLCGFHDVFVAARPCVISQLLLLLAAYDWPFLKAALSLSLSPLLTFWPPLHTDEGKGGGPNRSPRMRTRRGGMQAFFQRPPMRAGKAQPGEERNSKPHAANDKLVAAFYPSFLAFPSKVIQTSSNICSNPTPSPPFKMLLHYHSFKI